MRSPKLLSSLFGARDHASPAATPQAVSLTAAQLSCLEALAPGARTIEDCLAATRRELAGVLGLAEGEVEARIDRQHFQREGGGPLSQAEVTKLYESEGYCIDNALNNVSKLRDPQKAALRLAALEALLEKADRGILDYGCGAGSQAVMLKRLGAGRLCAAEVNETLTRFVAARLAYHGFAEVSVWNILAGPAPAETFGAALVLDVFPVIEKPAELVAALRPRLDDGALVVCNMGDIKQDARARWSYLIGRSPEEIRAAFAGHGFTLVRSATFGDHELAVFRKEPA